MSNDSILPLWWIIFVFLVVRWAIKISYFVQTWKFSKFRNSFLIIFLSFHGYIKLKKTLNFKLPQTSWFTFAVWKVSKYKVFSGLYLPAFRLNTEIYGVSLRIQSESGKIRTRENSVFGHFSLSDFPHGRKNIDVEIRMTHINR